MRICRAGCDNGVAFFAAAGILLKTASNSAHAIVGLINQKSKY